MARTLFERAEIRRDIAAQVEAGGVPSMDALRHGTLRIAYYSPIDVDYQRPHTQDEVYVVVSGSGTFYNEGETVRFQAGDAMFAAAGTEHRFVDFENLEVWAIFYGPEGGEAPDG